MLSLGIDIGGTSVKIAAVEDGRTVLTGQSPFYARPDTASLIRAIKAAVAGRVTKVDTAGICVPGLLDREKRMITLSVNVPGLMNIVLDDLVAQALDGKVPHLTISSDAVASAYDVMDSRKLQGRVFALAIGTGVGAAVLDEGGVPLQVSGSSPGHFGQIDVTLPDEPDVIGPDGGQGSLEGYLGVGALKKRYRVEDLGTVLPKLTAADAPIRALARALRIAHGIYRPQHQLLLGGLGTRLKHVVPDLKKLVGTNLTRVAREGWTLEAGDSDFHAAQGAAKMALKSVGK